MLSPESHIREVAQSFPLADASNMLTVNPAPYTPRSTPYTLHPTPYTLQLTLHTLHPSRYTPTHPWTLSPVPWTPRICSWLDLNPQTRVLTPARPKPEMIHQHPKTLNPKIPRPQNPEPETLHRIPEILKPKHETRNQTRGQLGECGQENPKPLPPHQVTLRTNVDLAPGLRLNPKP